MVSFRNAFSRNGRPTIQAKGNPDQTLGNNHGLSIIDVKQLNAMYECNGKYPHAPLSTFL